MYIATKFCLTVAVIRLLAGCYRQSWLSAVYIAHILPAIGEACGKISL